MSTETASAVPSAPAEVDAEAGAGAVPVGLAERDREVLAFERHWWRYAGAKEAAIRDRFGLSATRYYQLLNALVDRPEALAADPLLVRRLRRMRAVRQRAHHGDVLGTEG
ncbi:DUF3263 domain-containing protein [Modestobacter sp. SYSU DS0290]